MDDSLEGLMTVAIEFAVSSLIFSVFSTILIIAAYDLGLRYSLNRVWIREWFVTKRLWGHEKTINELEYELAILTTNGNLKVLYDLPVDKLCGQVATQGESMSAHYSLSVFNPAPKTFSK